MVDFSYKYLTYDYIGLFLLIYYSYFRTMQGLVNKYLKFTGGADPDVEDNQATDKQVQVSSIPTLTLHLCINDTLEMIATLVI